VINNVISHCFAHLL